MKLRPIISTALLLCVFVAFQAIAQKSESRKPKESPFMKGCQLGWTDADVDAVLGQPSNVVGAWNAHKVPRNTPGYALILRGHSSAYLKAFKLYNSLSAHGKGFLFGEANGKQHQTEGRPFILEKVLTLSDFVSPNGKPPIKRPNSYKKGTRDYVDFRKGVEDGYRVGYYWNYSCD